MVEHYYLVGSCVYGLEFCHDALDVVERLQLMSRPIYHVTSIAADDRRDAFFSRFFSMVGGYGVSHDYDGWSRTASRIKAKITASPCDYEPDVGVHVTILAKGLDDRVCHV